MGVLVLNLKAYKETIAEGAESIAKIAKEVSQQTVVRIILAPKATDIHRISSIVETIAQHIDPIDPGKGT
ncbi:TPA: triose-phosphate isomerase, partial [archaeon]|nr:triose-phosphate isomerase [Candidatus Naiadarchaeales archaeon SRR2090159.bin1288]